MAVIESKRVEVEADSAEVYRFLEDMNNFKGLLPQDKISEWKASEKECSFKVKGGYTIGMAWKEGTPSSLIVLDSTKASPLPFTLNIHLEENGSATSAYQKCEVKANPFMMMMIEKPLKNLFDHIAGNLQIHFSK
jgi:carbon monoxide dehydrogenase subunit G